eukprot:scaffold1789_cov375-Prasinococcus_capsulatus_cf.AAC.13
MQGSVVPRRCNGVALGWHPIETQQNPFVAAWLEPHCKGTERAVSVRRRAIQNHVSESVIPLFVLLVALRPVLDQQLTDFRFALSSGKVQGGAATLVCGVRVSLLLEAQPDGVHVTAF